MSLPLGDAGKVYAVAKITAFHIICHVVAHPQPPKVVCNEFCCLPLSGVSSYRIVVVRFDDVKPELIFSGDVNISLVEN